MVMVMVMAPAKAVNHRSTASGGRLEGQREEDKAGDHEDGKNEGEGALYVRRVEELDPCMHALVRRLAHAGAYIFTYVRYR